MKDHAHDDTDDSVKNLEEHERKLLELLRSLDKEYPGLLVVVEGVRDEDILRDLGVKSDILRTQAG
ncbi:hypothetical protein EU524_01035, partial [Candidatus Thorarchaeota archaeon]